MNEVDRAMTLAATYEPSCAFGDERDEMAEALVVLRAEVDRLTAAARTCDTIDALRAEVAALREDADRPLQRRLFDECETAGWDPDKQNTFAEEIAHLHEEVSEAFREWRAHKDFAIRYDSDGKPTGIPIELADVLIGLFYNAELHGFDLLDAVEIKHRFNLRRSYQAEGRTLHPAAHAALVAGREGQ